MKNLGKPLAVYGGLRYRLRYRLFDQTNGQIGNRLYDQINSGIYLRINSRIYLRLNLHLRGQFRSLR